MNFWREFLKIPRKKFGKKFPREKYCHKNSGTDFEHISGKKIVRKNFKKKFKQRWFWEKKKFRKKFGGTSLGEFWVDNWKGKFRAKKSGRIKSGRQIQVSSGKKIFFQEKVKRIISGGL